MYRIRIPLFVIFALPVFMAQPNLSMAAESTEVDFSKEVLPILSNKCFACHGPDTQKKNALRLDSFASATEDRGGYKAIDTENPEDSEVLARIFDEEDPMPPEDAEKHLTDQERETIAKWVRSGGNYAKHWAYIPPDKRGKGATAKGHEIDAYVRGQLEEKNLDFAPEADRATLARRASLTLTGLPPEPDQLAEFLADERPDAYQKYVDGLLASPRFGEHQARYWLDAVRYGDTHGLHLDNRRGIYPYRDWVVRAFNNNLPLDKFITWQLAGDLMPDPSLEQLVATGFVRMNPTTAEGGAIAAEFQAKNNFDRTENLGTVLMGMTLTCARCHTHKYDPITQTEYYELLAFFNSTAESPLDGNKYDYAPVIKAPQDQGGWDAWDKLMEERAALLAKAESEIAKAENADSSEAKNWEKANTSSRLEMVTAPNGLFKESDLQKATADLAGRLAELEKSFTTTLIAKENRNPRPTKVLRRGEYDIPTGEPLQPNVPSIIGPLPDGAPANRLGLASWLTSEDHPLVSRVLINRVWQRIFGHGLVRTPEDFGLQGEQPTHPELLDWLAVELQESGWDMKHMIRLMVTSRTFRQSSAWRPELGDTSNQLLARGPGYRLDAEVIRDLGLWASGLLDPTMGGEGVKPYQPAGMWSALMHPASNTKNYVADKGARLYRRSLYVYWKRTSPHPMMTLFDAPVREFSCVNRSRSNTSLQSLGLLNETQRVEMSRKLAERVYKAGEDDGARLNFLFTLIASRQPDDIEKRALLALLETMREKFTSSQKDADQLLATGEAQVDGSIDKPDLAAWTQVCATVLASDTAILTY